MDDITLTRIAMMVLAALGAAAISYVWATREKRPRRRVDTFDGSN